MQVLHQRLDGGEAKIGTPNYGWFPSAKRFKNLPTNSLSASFLTATTVYAIPQQLFRFDTPGWETILQIRT
jgi:hypothetical protein